jgi:predicted DNA-binding transcriptional regulator AlpA
MRSSDLFRVKERQAHRSTCGNGERPGQGLRTMSHHSPMWRVWCYLSATQGKMMTSPGIRLVEIAELLGVTKQRAHQIAEQKGFPAPLAEDARGRVWSRYEVQPWAKRWRTGKPWRRDPGR